MSFVHPDRLTKTLFMAIAAAFLPLAATVAGAQSVPDPNSVNGTATASSAVSADIVTAGGLTTRSSAVGNDSSAEQFVFDQQLNVVAGDAVRDLSAGAQVALGDRALSGVSGAIALNQAAGVANQQGAIVKVVTDALGGAAADSARSLEVRSQQTLNVAGTIEAAGTGGYAASIDANALENATGVVAINQAAGVANQQVSTLLWYGAPPSGASQGGR